MSSTSTTEVSYRSTVALQTANGATPHHGETNGYHHHLSNGYAMRGAAAQSQYGAKKQGTPAVTRHREGDREATWLTTANFVKLSACAAAGVVFGFAAEKAKGEWNHRFLFSCGVFCLFALRP